MEVIKDTELDTEMSELMIFDGIHNMKSKYQLPDAFSGKPKKTNIKFENVPDMYRPDARMFSYKTRIDSLLAWFLAFERRYWEQLGSDECLEVNRIDFRRKDEDSKDPNRWSFGYLNFTKYVTNIIAEPKYKYEQQEQVIVRNHNRSIALELSVLKYCVGVVGVVCVGGGWLKPVLRAPSLALGFCHGSKHTVVWSA